MRPVYLVELPTLTPREVALKSCPPNETETQLLTLHLEVSRAEKRYAEEQRAIPSGIAWDNRPAGGDFSVDYPPSTKRTP